MTTFTAVIVDPAGLSVLIDSQTGELPICTVDIVPYFARAAEYNAIVFEQIGIKVSTLQCLTAPGANAPGAFAFRSASDQPDRLTWIPIHTYQPGNGAIRAYLSGINSRDRDDTIPWNHPDWLPQMQSWIDGVLDHVDSVPEQVKSWGISAVWKVESGQKTHYFKAVPPLFAGEPEITAYLGSLFGEQVPKVEAIDHARHWMLMSEFAGPLLRDNRKTAIWTSAARQYTQIQMDSIPHIPGLLSAGCANRPLDGLAADFHSLMAALADEEFRTDSGLSVDEAASVVAQADYVSLLCARLAHFKLPPTLIHGDLHAGNVVNGVNGFLYFDWTDAAISHPFFDLLTLIGEDWLKDETEIRDEILRAYCEPWTNLASTQDLVAAVDIALKLAPAYHAVSYRRIRDASPPASRWELGPFMGYYLRQLI